MSLEWIRENPARWDGDKIRIVGGADEGVFDHRLAAREEGEIVPGEWWRVQEEGRVVGYGWLDIVWGDAEILLATDPAARDRGIGTFILDHLDAEARKRGLNYLYNVIRPDHPRAEELARWLSKRGFTADEGGRLMRSVVRPTQLRPPTT